MMTEELQRAREVILSGGTILYPTDTIWGIGCDATGDEAVQKIYRIKRRSDRKSMLVLVSGTVMLSAYLREIPDRAMQIIQTAQKPTTIIYPGGMNLAPGLLTEKGSVGIRITRDPFCRQLIELVGRPIVSTSANISGHPAPATFREIEKTILNRVDYVVKWRQEEMQPSAPSAVIELDPGGGVRIIRE